MELKEFEAASKLGQKRANVGIAIVCLTKKDQNCTKAHLKEFLKLRQMKRWRARFLFRSYDRVSFATF